ncbi:MAG: hypothetical protein ACT4OX_02595 [Actinomycetota bacterium]
MRWSLCVATAIVLIASTAPAEAAPRPKVQTPSFRVHILDSTINQTYKHGSLRFIATAGSDGKYATDAMVLTATNITTKSPPLYVPLPTW